MPLLFDDIAVNIMGVIMVVRVDRKVVGDLAAEQLEIGRMPRHALRMTGAADMAVEAKHVIGRGHHQVQVMRDHEHAAMVLVPDAPDEGIELRLPGHIDTLNGFVEHQQVGLPQQRTRQQDTLMLSTGEVLHRLSEQVRNTEFIDDPRAIRIFPVACKPEKPLYRQRQVLGNLESLRHIADGDVSHAFYTAGIRLHQAEHDPNQRGFTSPVRTDQRHDLPAGYRKVYLVENRTSAQRDADPGRLDEL